MNADGHVDMILAGQDGIDIKQGNGRGSFPVVEKITDQEVSEILPVDLNGDGQNELLGVNLASIYKWQKTKFLNNLFYLKIQLVLSINYKVSTLIKMDWLIWYTLMVISRLLY